MRWLTAIGRELLGLFVDDGRDALAILAWLVFAGLVLPRLNPPSAVPPSILFLGLAAILVASATRRARKGRSG
jgi:hypothetical protein